jgi:pyruvate/2-oxoglutarate dehydrogenase complex dihydrolipoamide acyltransferase (E2) component
MGTTPIRIPKVSAAAHEATLTQYLVDHGDPVADGAPLFCIETDKVETEIDAAAAGVVYWTATAGETYEVGTEVGYIETED